MESEQRKNAIRGAYHLTGSNNFYDGMITCSTFSGKAVCRMVWAMNRQECEDYLSKALSGIPEDFAGTMLEVPVGTGILTMPVYQTLPKADVTCLDYSPDMMGQAKEKAEKLHLTNVKFRRGMSARCHSRTANLIWCCRSTASMRSRIRKRRTARHSAC